MVAPLRRKNALEQTGFARTEKGFSYRGLLYHFEDVNETARFRQRLETKVNFVLSSVTHSISVGFSMTTGETVQLTEQPTWFSKGLPENIERIEEIFRVVSANSFDVRLQKYLKQMQTHQFFDYAGWHFYPTTHTIVNFETKQTYSTRSAKLLRSYGCVEIRESTEGVGTAVGRIFRGGVGINTLRDTDVFFALLNEFFGLAWK